MIQKLIDGYVKVLEMMDAISIDSISYVGINLTRKVMTRSDIKSRITSCKIVNCLENDDPVKETLIELLPNHMSDLNQIYKAVMNA